MSFITNIKVKLANKNIQNKIQENPRKKEFHNLNSAKSIGILFDTLDDKNYGIIKKFATDLIKKNYKVTAIGWVNANELPEFGIAQTISLYTNKDYKWNGDPIAEEINEFIDQKFDLLFVLSQSENISISYISKLSKAACKVGAHNNDCEHLDLMIQQTKNKSIENLIEESLNYLALIKKE